MSVDSDLPVFSFRPNWREPMVERLSFLTDVLRASKGAEQVRSLRDTPRRSFDADFLLTARERAYWDLFINTLGGQEVAAPLYWEGTTLSVDLPAAGPTRIDFDTTYREWQYHTGLLALLVGQSALDWEVVEIAAVDDAGVDLLAPTVRTWPKGTKLYPLRRCVLDQAGDLDHATAGVANSTAQLRVIGANPWVPAEDTSPTYLGLPVFLEEPNWVEDLSVSFDREVSMLDTGMGRTYQVDGLGRALLGQSHRWFLPGRQRLAAFRDMIYRHKGRAGLFWLPTFKADLKVAAFSTAGSQRIIVENAGYQYTGGPGRGREHIAIKRASGTRYYRIASVEPGETAGTEQLNLPGLQIVGVDLRPADVLRTSFMDTARFDSDDFEITHYGGIDGHHEASTMFRSVKNTRTAPTPVSLPISTAFEDDGACGRIPWYIRIKVEFTNWLTPMISNVYFINPEDGPILNSSTQTEDTSLNHRIPRDFDSVEWVWAEQDLPPQVILFTLSGAQPGWTSQSRFRVSARRYGEEFFTPLVPIDDEEYDSFSNSNEEGYFTVRNRLSSRWWFNI